MNFYKKYIFAVTVVALLVISCGDDEDKGVLRYDYSGSGSEIFIMYTGSDKGGQQVDPDSIKVPQETYFPTLFLENYGNTSISFISDSIVMIEQQGSFAERNVYRFDDGSFYLRKGSNYRYFGDGNKSMINVRQHYISYKRQGETSFSLMQAKSQKEVNAEKAAFETPYGSISNMKSEEDTLIWCTWNSFFR